MSMKELIAYETWHEVMWLGGEDQDEAWLDGPIASVTTTDWFTIATFTVVEIEATMWYLHRQLER
jgi:hypothetical protein